MTGRARASTPTNRHVDVVKGAGVASLDVVLEVIGCCSFAVGLKDDKVTFRMHLS